MDRRELSALPQGAVVAVISGEKCFRKGPRDTWHQITTYTGERMGQRDAIRSSYLESTVGPVTNSTAQTDRLMMNPPPRNKFA